MLLPSLLKLCISCLASFGQALRHGSRSSAERLRGEEHTASSQQGKQEIEERREERRGFGKQVFLLFEDLISYFVSFPLPSLLHAFFCFVHLKINERHLAVGRRSRFEATVRVYFFWQTFLAPKDSRVKTNGLGFSVIRLLPREEKLG